jgi:hypothetical protein
MAGDDRVKQACAYLRMLLLRPGEYRAAWQQRGASSTADDIDAEAVAAVLADSSPGGEAGQDLVQTVRDALEGNGLSPTTLNRFIEAFALRRRQATRLRELLRGTAAVRVIRGDLQLPENMPPVPARYQTLSLHESHVLGPDGLPAEHQTIQVIRSLVDELTSVPYRFDTDELVVEVVRGGRVGDRVYRLTDTLYAVDILLHSPLARGETELMQYRTTFFYRSAPEPEFRRGVLGSTEDLTVWVTFHRDRLPRRVWLARWDAWDRAKVIDQEPVDLDDELSVHHRFGAVERAIVGFYWEWD